MTDASRRGDATTYVAFDLGTNTFRWLAAAKRGEAWTELARGREIVSIGRSLRDTGRFEAQELADAAAVLRAWMPGGGIVPAADTALAMATHAFRAAANGVEAARDLTAATGIAIEIVPPEREAALTYLGVTQAVAAAGPLVALDIGGGSTELSWGEGGRLQGAFSLPIGVVTLAAAGDETLRTSLRRAREAFDAACRQVYNDLPSMAFRNLAKSNLISTCGTSSALAMEHAGRADYDRSALDGHVVERAWLDTLVEARSGWRPADWRTLAPVGDKRAALMGPGIGILTAFLDALDVQSWRNCEAGLLEGAMNDLIQRPRDRRPAIPHA